MPLPDHIRVHEPHPLAPTLTPPTHTHTHHAPARLYELRQLEMAQRGQEIAAAEEATRRVMDANTRAYNARLAAAQREADQRRLIEETNERLEEINNNLHSDFLTEVNFFLGCVGLWRAYACLGREGKKGGGGVMVAVALFASL